MQTNHFCYQKFYTYTYDILKFWIPGSCPAPTTANPSGGGSPSPGSGNQTTLTDEADGNWNGKVFS